MDMKGHGEFCYYCHKRCNSLAGNPGEWPIPLCHADDPGRVKWHHIECVSMRLRGYARLDSLYHKMKHDTFGDELLGTLHNNTDCAKCELAEILGYSSYLPSKSKNSVVKTERRSWSKFEWSEFLTGLGLLTWIVATSHEKLQLFLGCFAVLIMGEAFFHEVFRRKLKGGSDERNVGDV
jgi:hypothetical protein